MERAKLSQFQLLFADRFTVLFLWIPLGSLGFICRQILQTLPLCFIFLPPALTLILWSSVGCCWFSPYHLYILKFVGIFHHPVLLYFLDLISSCPIWSVWGLGYCEMMLLLPPSFQNASQWSHFNILKNVHEQVDGCNSCLSWGTERKMYWLVLLLLGKKSRKAPTILVEGRFSREAAVLFLISFCSQHFNSCRVWFYRSETQLLLLTMGCALFLFHKQPQWFRVPWSQALTYFKNISCYHVESVWVLSSFAFLWFWFYLQGENCILGVLSTSILCPLCLSVQFICSVMCDSLWPHGLQHARLPCPSPTPGACSNSCPSSWWCHPTISSSVISMFILWIELRCGPFPEDV